MGQIITSLINFFLEVSRSGQEYRTRRTKSRSTKLILFFVISLLAFTSYESFVSAFSSKAEVVKLKEKLILCEYILRENDALETRNEILATALAYHTGKEYVDTLNNKKDSGLSTKINSGPKKKQ